MRRSIDGSIILYWLLLILVMLSYSVPIFVAITTLVPQPRPFITIVLYLVAALVVALTFKPVWKWVQPRVHHVMYAMDDPHGEIIGQINNLLASALPESLMLTMVAETIAQIVNVPYVRIETANDSVTEVGKPFKSGVRTRIEITYREISVGWVEVMSRLPGELLTTGEYQLLYNLARQVAIILHAAQLTADLQASREQLVTAREEERRRIRRDLHDGLGPTLAALRLQLSALRHLVRQSPDDAERLIDELRHDVRTATAEIRQLVYALRPPMLDEFGLVSALRNLELTSDGLVRSVVAPEPFPLLPAALEVALYRIAAEALHNIVRHAQATHCAICLTVNPTTVTLSVTDNGCGLPAAYLAGVGHASMHERAAELSGSVTIFSAPTGGTGIAAIFPFKGIPDA